MADTNPTVCIGSQDIRLGDADNSRLIINITNNTGNKLQYGYYLVLPTAFVSAEKVNAICCKDFDATVIASESADVTTLRIGPGRGIELKSGATTTFTLSKIAVASAGKSTIELEWREGTRKVDFAPLTITVSSADNEPRIIDFAAKDYILTHTPNRTATPVRLKWKTDGASVVELMRLGNKLLPLPGQESAPSETVDWWQDCSCDAPGIQPYQLTATAGGKTVSRWLFVRRQQTGWNKLECVRGVPTLLVNDADSCLYGVFQQSDGAALYRLDTKKGGLGADDEFIAWVPKGMESSPGCFFEGKIWLLGGSQIDPRKVSNECWRIDPKEHAVEQVNADWTPRMGHACAVFDHRLWVLGGANQKSTLSEVHCFDGKTWTQGEPLGKPMCQLSAVGFDNRLWAYGGTSALFGSPLKELWCWSRFGEPWKQIQFYVGDAVSSDPGIGAPFGAALCVRKRGEGKALSILGTFRDDRSAAVASTMYTLSGWEDSSAADLERFPLPIREEIGWPTRLRPSDTLQVFRLSAIGFGSCVFVLSLVYDADSSELTYLVLP